MHEPLGAALAIGLAAIAALVAFAFLATRRQRRAPLRFAPVAGPLAILRIPQGAGEAALRAHALDARERRVFEAMDAALVPLAETGDVARDFAARCEAAAAVGAAHGLDREQSIAFWVRATFSRFEPADGHA